MCALKTKSYIQIQTFQFGQTYNPPPFWKCPNLFDSEKKVLQAIWASPEPPPPPPSAQCPDLSSFLCVCSLSYNAF